MDMSIQGHGGTQVRIAYGQISDRCPFRVPRWLKVHGTVKSGLGNDIYSPHRHAIRYNMLVNPSGKPGKFRAVDWVEESMINLYTKV